MRILVIGSTSVIGRALANRCERLGRVDFAGRRQAHIFMNLTEWQTLTQTDVFYDVVVHAAADFGGSGDEDLVRAELVNAVGTLNVCRLTRAVGAKHLIILSSLSATYKPTNPFYDIYAISKRHSEELAAFYCAKHEIPLTILRPSQVYDAAGACRNHQPFLYFVADKAEAGEDISLHGTHDAVRNYLNLEDLAEVCARVIERHCLGVFSCCYPSSVRLSEVAQAAITAFGRGGKIEFVPDKPDLPDLPASDDFRLYDLIGYSPVTDISAGFRLIRDFREALL